MLVGPVRLKKEKTDLNVIVEQLVEFFSPEAQRHEITVSAQYHPHPLICNIDSQIFKQAVLNLLINAQQATRPGGEIRLNTAIADDQAILQVADTGEGMAPDVARKAMQAFYSTKPKGSGLGLSTTLRIVTAHDGTLNLLPRSKGACFEIRIPRSG